MRPWLRTPPAAGFALAPPNGAPKLRCRKLPPLHSVGHWLWPAAGIGSLQTPTVDQVQDLAHGVAVPEIDRRVVELGEQGLVELGP